MNVSCPECRSVFRIDPAKVPATGVDARCNVCGAVIAVHDSVSRDEAARRTRTASAASHAPDGADMVSRVAASATAPIDTPSVVASRETSTELTAVARPSPEPLAEPAPVESRAPVSQRLTPEPVATGEVTVEARARPVNPYLNNTPELRARRLARALVSDLVAYNPQKREQGLRDGTLRQLFREEIRKSWDEYVEQVGATVAESTPHFQDALNDVLAGGRRVF